MTSLSTIDTNELTNEQIAELKREQGLRWERYIRAECRMLADAGRALVRKNWEAPRIPGRHERIESSKPDFSGFITDDSARHVVFEAKSNVITTRLPFGQLTDGQLEQLEAADAAGCISFVYAIDGLERKWIIPTGEILRLRAVEGLESYSYTDDDPRQKRNGENWLDAYLRLENKGLT